MDFSTLWIGRTASCSPPTHTPRQPGVAARMPKAGQLPTKKVRQRPRGLLSAGDGEGTVHALDAAAGKPLWHWRMGGAVCASPMAFAVDGQEYVGIAAGSSLYACGLA